MASGQVNRFYRPNTWQHRPSLRREDFSCQPGAVHTWQTDMPQPAAVSPLDPEPDIGRAQQRCLDAGSAPMKVVGFVAMMRLLS
jgi:hypothetical protein